MLWDLSDGLEPEDGKLWIHDVDGLATMAFTEFGLQNLREIIRDQIDVARNLRTNLNSLSRVDYGTTLRDRPDTYTIEARLDFTAIFLQAR